MQPRTFNSVDEAIAGIEVHLFPQIRRMKTLPRPKYERLLRNNHKLLRHMLGRMVNPETGLVEFHPGRAGFDVPGLEWPKGLSGNE